MPRFESYMMGKASKIISAAVLGLDGSTVSVGGKAYHVPAPTIARIAGAAYWLDGIGDGSTVREAISAVNDSDRLAKALSWFIAGDESLSAELQAGTFDEVLDGLETAYSMITAQNFTRLSTLARSVAGLTAKPKS